MIEPEVVSADESARFVEYFGIPFEASGRAHARVNLIGEHTDYNGGRVLPTLLPLTTTVLLARRDDGRGVVVSRGKEGEVRGELRIGEERRTGDFIDYMAGLTWAIGQRGIPLRGFSAMISSRIPMGAGLSSSAALLVAFGRGLRAMLGLDLDDEALALLAHEAETHFVGAPVGVMDPVAVGLGRQGAAMLLDTRTLYREEIALPHEASFLVVHSGLAHRHQTGGYAARREECNRAASMLCVEFLTDVQPADARISRLPSPLDRRVRHVVTENARVDRAAAALRLRDLRHLGALFYESHASMRDDFEVSTPEIDRLVEIARRQPGVLGARLTGGGFGGAIVVLSASHGASRVAATIVDEARAAGLDATRALVPTEVPP